MKKIILPIFLILMSFLASAQNEVKLAKEGTFQFVQKSKVKEVFTTEKYDEIKQLIASKRKDNSDITLSISELTLVKIPSKKKINNDNFQPFTTLFQ